MVDKGRGGGRKRLTRCILPLVVGSLVVASLDLGNVARAVGLYEGFGSVTRGAEDCPDAGGFEVYTVTSLADSGPGTLRDAVSRRCRYVRFSVGGTITLQSTLNVPYSYITIDGASAPAPGITISTPQVRTVIEASSAIGPAHDIIIHHLRMRGAGGSVESKDIWELDGQSASVYNIVLDHITAISSSDGNFDIWGEVRDVTISNNLYLDSIQGGHFSMVTPPNRERISIHHNVFARLNERQVRMRYDNRVIDIVNNVIYGWGWFEGGAAGLDLPSDAGFSPSINVENNVYQYVPGLSGTQDDAVKYNRATFPGSIFFSGNVFPVGESDAVSTSGQIPIPTYARVTKHPAATLGITVVPCAGTRFPTPEEQSLLREISLAIGGDGRACQDSVPAAPSNLRIP